MTKPHHALTTFVLGLFCLAVSGHLAVSEQIGTDQRQTIGQLTAQALRDLLNAHVTEGHVANISFGVWQDGALVADGYFGRVSESNPTPVTDTTIYRIQSMTKPVTAIGLLILMERGHFSLDDPITKFLPEFENTQTLADYDSNGKMYTYLSLYPPTMKQLLSHTAGLGYWQETGNPVDQKLLDSGISSSKTSDALVKSAAQIPYVSMPGAEWHYSMASDLQGAIIERITGEPLSQFLDREVFKPLEMVDTGFHVPSHKQTRLSGVTTLDKVGAHYVAMGDPGHESQSQAYAEGGHGLFSTQRDYYQFLEFLRQDGQHAGRQILSPKTLKIFRTNAIKYRGGPGRQSPYGARAGLGFGLGVATIENSPVSKLAAPKGTYYWHGSLGTWFWVDPVNDLVFIGMVQSQTVIEPNLIRASMDAVYGTRAEPSINDTPS